MLKHGVIPVTDHYYDPLPSRGSVARDEWGERQLPGIDLNVEGQRQLLRSLTCEAEIADWRLATTSAEVDRCHRRGEFCFGNGSFESGDAELLYQVVRHFGPSSVIEVGAGSSSLIIARALQTNARTQSAPASHICVEPYEVPWLETVGMKVVRRPVQELELDYFLQLKSGDMLFVDGSHMVKPGGDVLFFLQTVLPALAPGVIVHVHDIFTPRDYLPEWLLGDVKLWNEQYFVETFLTHNSAWEITLAANWLKHNCYEELQRACPFLNPAREPGSMYMRRIH